jgi:hypothetical protein
MSEAEITRITPKQFREAMIIVQSYCDQVYEIKNNLYAWRIGTLVKLSAWGREAQRSHGKTGKVVDWFEWHSKTDGLVTVKWEGVKKPVEMHISQVQVVG